MAAHFTVLVSDEGLAALSKCSQLSDLKLDGTKITDQSIAALAELPLSSISLENTSITDPSFQVLLGISSLRFLSLSNTRITGTGAISRETGEPVSVIDLNACPLTHDGVTALAGAKYMSAIYDKTSLWLNRTPLTDNDLLLFADNDEIGHLGIAGTKITSAGLKALYTARKKRLQAAGTEEWLTVESDFPDIADRFLPNPALPPAEPPSNEDATATNPPQP